MTLTGVFPVGERLTVRAGAGALLDGTLRPAGGRDQDFEPGGLVFAGLERRGRAREGLVPALDVSLLVGVTWAQTTDRGTDLRTDYSAFDVRLGARGTWRLAGRFFPFAAARVFGGPVNWQLDGDTVTGTDVHHYQLAVGAAARLGPVIPFVEWAGLGERGLSLGMGTVW